MDSPDWQEYRREAGLPSLSPLVAFVCGLLLTAVGYATASRLSREGLGRDFQELAEARITTIERVVGAHLDVMQGVAALYDTSDDIRHSQFTTFVTPLLSRHPGILALEWVPRVPHKQRARLRRAAAFDGFTQFQITERAEDGRLRVAPERAEYFPVLFMAPHAGNQAALGFDLASDPLRHAALQLAMRTGETTATGQVELYEAPAARRGVLVFHPRYQGPAGRPLLERFEGFVLGVLQVDQLLAAPLALLPGAGIRVEIRDNSASGADSQLATFAPPGEDGVKTVPGLSRLREINVAGRKWSIRCLPTPAFVGNRALATPVVVLCAGVCLSILLAAYMLLLVRHSERVERANVVLKAADDLHKRYTERVLSAQDEERGRLARELHDETGQSMTSLIAGLGALEAGAKADGQRRQLHELRELAERTLDDLGRMARGLHPSTLDTLGLRVAVDNLVRQVTRGQGLEVEVEMEGLQDGRRLPSAVEVTLYRILQEALTNAIKHGAAHRVRVALHCAEGRIRMRVQDDGHGFAMDRQTGQPGADLGLGIHGMRERASLVGGKLRVHSAVGAGTEILVDVPLEVG